MSEPLSRLDEVITARQRTIRLVKILEDVEQRVRNETRLDNDAVITVVRVETDDIYKHIYRALMVHG